MAKKGKKGSAPKKNANAYNKPPPIPQGEVIQDDRKKKWKIGPSIGIGGFGEIYSACEFKEDDTTSKDESSYTYVVKIEPIANGPLFVEMHFYERNCKQEYIQAFMESRNLSQVGMPTYHGSGSHNYQGTELRFLVLNRYGKDISKIFTEVGNQFPAATVFQLGLQMLDVLDYIHSRSYIHADLKGANMLLGVKEEDQNQAFLLDFGLAFRIVGDNYRPKPINAHEGTLEYTSRDRHIGAQTMRGDLEILAYNMLQWLVGALPWQAEQHPETVHKIKADFLTDVRDKIKNGFSHVPDELIQFFEYVNSLDLSDKPNYFRCREIFEGFLKKAGKARNSKFEFTNANDERPPLITNSTDLQLNEIVQCTNKSHTDINNVTDSITNLDVSSMNITSTEEVVFQRTKRIRNPPKRYTSESGTESETPKTNQIQKVKTNDKNLFANPTPTHEKKNIVDKQNGSKQKVTKSNKAKASSSKLEVIEAETELQNQVEENKTNEEIKNKPEITSIVGLGLEKHLVTKDNGKKFKHKPLLETDDVVEVPVKHSKAMNSKKSKCIETISLIDNNGMDTIDDNQEKCFANNNEFKEDNCSRVVSQAESYEENDQTDECRSKKTKEEKKIRKESIKMSLTKTPVENEVESYRDDQGKPDTDKQNTKNNKDMETEVPALIANKKISRNKKSNEKKKLGVELLKEVEENLNGLPKVSCSTPSKGTEDSNLIHENKMGINNKSKKSKQIKSEVPLPTIDHSLAEIPITNMEIKKVVKNNKTGGVILKDPENLHPTDHDNIKNQILIKDSKEKALSEPIKSKKKNENIVNSLKEPVCELQDNIQEEIITKKKRSQQKIRNKTETTEPEESDHDQSQEKRKGKETNSKNKQKTSEILKTGNEYHQEDNSGGIVTDSETTVKKKKKKIVKNLGENTYTIETNDVSEEPTEETALKKKKKNKVCDYSFKENDIYEVHTELSHDIVEQLATKNRKRKLSDAKDKKSQSQSTETDTADFKSDENLKNPIKNKKRNKINKDELATEDANVDNNSDDDSGQIPTKKIRKRKNKEKLASEDTNVGDKSYDDLEQIPTKKKSNKKDKGKSASEDTNVDNKSDDDLKQIPANKKDKRKSESEDTNVNNKSDDDSGQIPTKKKRNKKNKGQSASEGTNVDSKSDDDLELIPTKKKRNKKDKGKSESEDTNVDNKSNDDSGQIPTKKKRNKKNKGKSASEDTNVDNKSDDDLELIPTKKKRNKKNKEELASQDTNVVNNSDDDLEQIPKKKKRNKKNKGKLASEDTNVGNKSNDDLEQIPKKKIRNKKDKGKSALEDINIVENLDIHQNVEVRKRKCSELAAPKDNGIENPTDSSSENEFLIEKKNRKVNKKKKRNSNESSFLEYSLTSPRRSIRCFGMERPSYKKYLK